MLRMTKKPDILARSIVAKSRLFKIEALHLRFSNGAERHFERLISRAKAAVLIIPMKSDDIFLLVREYCAGSERYEIGFPKGLVELDEDFLIAANREMMEEVGYKSENMELLSTMSTAPGYWGSNAGIVLAQDLKPATLPGDEPEPLEVIEWSLKDYKKLLQREDFTEAKSIAALLLLKERLS